MHTDELVDPRDLITTQEAAQALRVSRQRVWQLKDSGDLRPVVERTRLTLFLRQEVEKVAERRAA